jgi:hypothetical protein
LIGVIAILKKMIQNVSTWSLYEQNAIESSCAVKTLALKAMQSNRYMQKQLQTLVNRMIAVMLITMPILQNTL